MKFKSDARTWMLIFTGFSWLIASLLGASSGVELLETRFYQRILQLSPSIDMARPYTMDSFPFILHQLVLISIFALLFLDVKYFKHSGRSPVMVILVVFSLVMLQMILAVLQHIWLPVVWASICFAFTAAILLLWAWLPSIRGIFYPSPPNHIDTIKKYISEQDYIAAVYGLKNGAFSEEMFELAYELGIKLEQEENWALARVLYVWLVQFDPGMHDFVERIDNIIKKPMDGDLSLPDITETRSQFAHYQLLGKKARGATATVYEAHDLNTHERIALKILNERQKKDTASQEIMTFLHEALAISSLDHPNIVKIHDADIIGDRAYIAMEYIYGYPMSERLRRKKYLTAAESLRIMRSVLNALATAHQEGIVHGDIKPANIMYDQQKKHYIVTDFGAAYSAHRVQLDEKKIIGTPAYMSPEQLSGARIDGRSDLFSLGVTIYQLLTGRQPFSGEKLSLLKKNILEQKVDLDPLSVPDPIKRVLEKALQKKTYQRFADANQMLKAVIYCQEMLSQKTKKQSTK